MTEEVRFDIAVVGAGIAGASLAARLAAHRSVVLLEREPQPGYHSTGRSAAMFMESYGPPAVRALTRASRHFYLQPPDGFTDVPLLAPRGALYLAQTGEQDLLHKLRLELQDGCPDLRQLDRAQVLETVPCLRPENTCAGLLDPMAMDIDVHALHQGFLRQMRRHGGSLRTNADVLAARRNQGVWQLELAGAGRVQAQVVVNAAGAWADQLGGQFGARAIGLVPHRRSAFTFRAPQDVDTSAWPVVTSLSESSIDCEPPTLKWTRPRRSHLRCASSAIAFESSILVGCRYWLATCGSVSSWRFITSLRRLLA